MQPAAFPTNEGPMPPMTHLPSPSRSTFETFVDEYRDVFAYGEATADDFRPLNLSDSSQPPPDRVADLLDRLEGLTSRFQDLLGASAGELRPIVFDGPGFFDGHAALLEEAAWVFFDMALVDGHLARDDFRSDVHLAHEATHALHYEAAPAFYPGRDKSPAERIWHRLVAEGLALRLSERVAAVDPDLSSWFGLIDPADFQLWRAAAEEKRAELGRAILTCRDNPRFGSDLWRELFRDPSPTSGGRCGYWYGRQIVRRAEARASLGELLRRQPAAWLDDVRIYLTP
jgi:hypothetical protein